jgi:hypothetical protein
MTSTEIANEALGKIAAGRINSLDDTGTKVETVKGALERVRDSVLNIAAWNFANARASLTAHAAAPVWEYDFSYGLPADPYCIRVLHVEGETDRNGAWVIEGRNLITSISGPINILYTQRVEEYGSWSPLARDLLVTQLASDLSVTLGGNPTSIAKVAGELPLLIATATSQDGKEGSNKPINRSTFVTARFS